MPGREVGRTVSRSHDEEEAAARAVQRVIGGTWELEDTGAEPGKFDVLHTLASGDRIALEVTSEGTYDQRKTHRAIQRRTDDGDFAGASLSCQWHVHVPTTLRISTLRARDLEEALRGIEAQGLVSVSAVGAHTSYGDRASRSLARLGVESAVLWNPSPPSGVPKILLSQSFSVIGEHTSLPDALRRVLARTDNQDKLAAAEADARHLYVFMHDRAAANGLRGIWPLPACPPDPRGVVDMIWVFAPWASSAYLHRVVPGSDQWKRFVTATGEPAPESALSGS